MIVDRFVGLAASRALASEPILGFLVHKARLSVESVGT